MEQNVKPSTVTVFSYIYHFNPIDLLVLEIHVLEKLYRNRIILQKFLVFNPTRQVSI